MSRSVTLIDADTNLTARLAQELSRRGLVAEALTNADDLMARKDGIPALIVLCIDPKRTGWAVCNRLRKSPTVQAVVAKAHGSEWSQGKPIWVWNGDWIQTPGEAGNGLAVLREAMAWEIGFAPQACRAEPERGMVVISLNDAPGSPRLAVGGGGHWRWSELPIARGTKSAMAGTYR